VTTPDLTLIIGGIRSGKSELAERLAGEYGASIGYVATGAASDNEMQARVEEHRRRRPEGWVTVEAPEGRVAAMLEDHIGGIQAVLLDDIGGLVTQVVFGTKTVAEADALLEREERAFLSLMQSAMLPSIVVTSEVGLSLVPTSEIGRRFADVLGRANQRWATCASNVMLVIAGLPMRLK
jgi:adenosylcobinamide kinase / adenosylcobinamide-phosphate guanylyltransferase